MSSINADRALEAQDGLIINECSGVFSGPDAPTGSDAPEGSLYFRQNGEVWKKNGPLSTDWDLLKASDIKYEPNGDITATNVQDAIQQGDRPFGKNAAFDQNPTGGTTTSGSFVSLLNLNFTLTETGFYRIGYNADNLETSKSNTIGENRLVIDSGTPNEIVIDELTSIFNLGQRLTGFDEGELTPGVHNIDFEFRRTAGNGFVSASEIRIEFWRVT